MINMLIFIFFYGSAIYWRFIYWYFQRNKVLFQFYFLFGVCLFVLFYMDSLYILRKVTCAGGAMCYSSFNFLKRNLKRIFIITFLPIVSIFINRALWHRGILFCKRLCYASPTSFNRFPPRGFPVNKNRCSIFYPCINTLELKLCTNYGGV